MFPASRRRQAGPDAQRGMTLIEALAAFVILSVGLLGIVSLQALSKTAQHQSIQRSRAVMIGNDMLERIRANPAGLLTYTSAAAPLGVTPIGTEPSPNCVAASCNPVQLATHDLWLWEQALIGATVTVTDDGVVSGTAGLIEPRACFDFAADTGKLRTGRLSVLVQWRGLNETSDAVQGTGAVACGGAAVGADGFRRQVIVSSYVIDEAEL
jgi:type IV pilus assembly protein PilV